MTRPLFPLLAIVATASLAACGGSGDGSPAASASADLATIDSANAVAIASSVAKAVYQSDDIGGAIDLTGTFGTTAAAKTESVYAKLGEIQMSVTGEMLKQSQIGTFQAPITPIETACEFGGSSVLSGDVQNQETLTVNDLIVLDFDNCDDGSVVVDGTISMTVLAFSGDFLGGSVSFSVRVTLTGFSISRDGNTRTASGTLTMDLNLPNAGPMSMTITAPSLVVSDGVSSVTLQSFSLTQTIDPETDSYSMTVAGTIDGSSFEGAVELTTSVVLAGTGDGYAATGELLITGDGGSSIAIFALDAELVRLEIDYDGDGVVDQVIDSTWTELLAA